MNSQEHLSTYSNCRVGMAKNTGELFLFLPLFSDTTPALLGKNQTNTLLESDLDLTIGFYEMVGILVAYDNKEAPVFFNEKSFDYIEDLGPLEE